MWNYIEYQNFLYHFLHDKIMFEREKFKIMCSHLKNIFPLYLTFPITPDSLTNFDPPSDAFQLKKSFFNISGIQKNMVAGKNL